MAGTAKYLQFLSAAAAALCLSLAPAAKAADKGPPEGVLIVHSNTRPVPAGVIIDDALRKLVPRDLARPVEIYSEFLDNERFATTGTTEVLADFLHRKYVGRNVRVLVAVVPQAFQFLMDHRDRILPGVPVVHLSMPRDLMPVQGLLPDVVGATIDLDPTPTLELALRLQPKAKQLVVVAGTSLRDREWEQRIRGAAARFADRLQVEYLMGLPTAEVLQRLGALSRDTIVYTPGYFADGTGRVITPRQSVEQMAAASTAPVYGPYDTFLGAGIVGGYITPYEEQAKHASTIIARLLSGTAPAAIPASSMQNIPIVDWRQLRRWKLDEKNLPPGAEVRFREPSVWALYWREISVGIAVLLLQAALIAALLVQRRHRRRAAKALAESEQRANLAARAAGLSAWIWETDGGRIRTSALPGSPDDLLDSVHPADRQEVRRAVLGALTQDTELNIEYRVLRSDGEVRWISARGRAQTGGDHRVIGVSMDITERKRAELQHSQDRASLRHMSRVSMLGQLSAAIAHQLNQPLAAILGNAEAAQKMLGRPQVDLAELRAICSDIVSEDHRAAEVIRRLRDLYRRGEIRREPCDLNALVREMVELLRTELMTRHVVVATELAPSLPPILGDRVQLQQVLLNLVLNAADAMQDAAEDRRIVTIRTELGDGRILLSVADQGPGVREEDLVNVFEGFWSTKADGMGVGLAISKSIVEAHGGSLGAANNAGGGATFRVGLPVQAQA